jgi:hypothetical protein
VTPLNTITFFLRSEVVAQLNPLVAEIASTTSIEEARRRLNERGVYTELDLEEDVYELIMSGKEVSGEALKELKRNRVANIRSRASRLQNA